MNEMLPPEKWQLEMIYDLIEMVPGFTLDWLLSYYGNTEQLTWWTGSYSRANELIERLEEDYDKFGRLQNSI
jgi:hypothetical protein